MGKLKFIGKVDIGYGPMHQVIEAGSEEDARQELYNWWLEEAENQSDRDLFPYTKELAEELEVE